MSLTTGSISRVEQCLTLIVIDEPETGAYTMAIRLPRRDAGCGLRTHQVLVATQSVTLLDNFPNRTGHRSRP